MPRIQNANIPAIQLVEQGSDYAAPPAGFVRIFAKSDGLYIVDESNTVTGPLGGAVDLSTADLGDIGDVDLTGINDGDILVWDAGTSTWLPDAPGSGGGGLTQAQVLARTLGA